MDTLLAGVRKEVPYPSTLRRKSSRAQMCNIWVPEELELTLVTWPVMRDKYQHFAFKVYMKSHPELRFSPESIYQIMVQSSENSTKQANRVSAVYNSVADFFWLLPYPAK